MIKSVLLCLLVIGSLAQSKKQINAKIDQTEIMYGSTIRLRAAAFAYHLHSHPVSYPLGSGFQSVTGMSQDSDYNSLWTLKEPNNQPVKTYHEQIKCGDTIRLEHALTKKNLHSEQIYQSMITKNQEVSCFGREGQGDENDNWVIKCLSKQEGDPFFGGDIFELIHENTEKKLKMSKFYEYSYNNWENCPFQNQLEVSATEKSTKETQFKIIGGVFFKDTVKESNDNKETIEEDL